MAKGHPSVFVNEYGTGREGLPPGLVPGRLLVVGWLSWHGRVGLGTGLGGSVHGTPTLGACVVTLSESPLFCSLSGRWGQCLPFAGPWGESEMEPGTWKVLEEEEEIPTRQLRAGLASFLEAWQPRERTLAEERRR